MRYFMLLAVLLGIVFTAVQAHAWIYGKALLTPGAGTILVVPPNTTIVAPTNTTIVAH